MNRESIAISFREVFEAKRETASDTPGQQAVFIGVVLSRTWHGCEKPSYILFGIDGEATKPCRRLFLGKVVGHISAGSFSYKAQSSRAPVYFPRGARVIFLKHSLAVPLSTQMYFFESLLCI